MMLISLFMELSRAAAEDSVASRFVATEFVPTLTYGAGKTDLPSGYSNGLIYGIIIMIVIGVIGLILSIIASIKCIKPLIGSNGALKGFDDELDDIFDE